MSGFSRKTRRLSRRTPRACDTARMRRAVRTVIRLIAAGIIVVAVMSLALEFTRSRQHRADFAVWRCVIDFLAVALGVVLFATSSKLAARLTDGFE